MSLSKEQRAELEEELTMPYGRVDLMCDGFKVTLSVQLWKRLVYRVFTYVNGEYSYRWAWNESPLPEQKFLRKSVRKVCSAKTRRAAEKACGKRYVKKDPFYSGTVTYFMPDWPNGRSAINHLCKVCESVEVVTPSQRTTFSVKLGGDAPPASEVTP
ncbi:hypothetical protein PAN31117_02789 [Pandoraea anapnoica]|uniref:Uncharacterized protein n=1 Tax=Pandoraea anapnoica TaxID=2508301 RepID=A0A5E5A2J7_9BURK|nr:hypothetical protein [Pandoraea anapnoica]VVE67849.1 hypothetical protein PAN31117_02789 [Pandoraea anapnoica]